MSGFRLSDLVPEPLTFTDDSFGGDGTIHDVLTVDLLSEQDIARMMQLQRRMVAAFAAERAGDAVQTLDELLGLLVPSLPAERLRAIPVTFKTRFLEWYQEQSPKVTGRAAAANPIPAQAAARSRGSSRATASRPKP